MPLHFLLRWGTWCMECMLQWVRVFRVFLQECGNKVWNGYEKNPESHSINALRKTIKNAVFSVNSVKKKVNSISFKIIWSWSVWKHFIPCTQERTIKYMNLYGYCESEDNGICGPENNIDITWVPHDIYNVFWLWVCLRWRANLWIVMNIRTIYDSIITVVKIETRVSKGVWRDVGDICDTHHTLIVSVEMWWKGVE